MPELSTEQVVQEVANAINGEYSAIQCYEKIANLAPTTAIRKQILEIRQDEIRHFQQFSQIYASLVGSQPQLKIVEPCPDTYKQGLEFAFLDEQETVDRYLSVYDRTSHSYIRNVFRRAALDEQNHAVWFLYYLTRKQA